MSKQANILFNRALTIPGLCAIIVLLTGDLRLQAQEKLPHPMTITAVPTQGLNFGAFCQGAVGGTVIMSPTGSRSTTGDVVQLGMGFVSTPALFDIETNAGTVVAVLNGPDATLTGSEGGTLSLHIGSSSPSAPFITSAIPPAKTTLSFGGTLTVGSPAANPPGSYSGAFYITFIHE